MCQESLVLVKKSSPFPTFDVANEGRGITYIEVAKGLDVLPNVTSAVERANRLVEEVAFWDRRSVFVFGLER